YNWMTTDGQEHNTKKKLVNMTFSNVGTYTISLIVKDDKGAESTAVQKTVTVTSPPLPNVPPTAAFSINPTEGEAPLTVTLDASSSTDSDGTIAEYNWMTTDGQEHNTKKKLVNMTFSNVGTYTISLIVKDDDGAESVAVQQTVTVTDNVTVEKPDTGNDDDDKAHLEFIGLEDFYRVGETVVMELVETANMDEYTRVDLWVAIQLPSEEFLFRTDIPMSPWSPQQQAHKTSIENTETSHHIFDFEVPEGLGGDYTLYAVYVKEGENPVTNGFAIRSNLVMQKIVLANRKE
ncbi:MAG: PKD domain-containing protein, partial [Bacteroides sp.]|nr:PKD domain-containing protein [Bacteroides sp.]